MNSVMKLAQQIRKGLDAHLGDLRKTVLRKLSLTVAALLEARKPGLAEIAARLPLKTTRSDMREQWLRRLLKNELLDPFEVMQPFARMELEKAASAGQTIFLQMDQTDLGDRFAVLMLALRVGGRSLPLLWKVESGAANIGFDGQQELLDRLLGWIPVGAQVMLLADRFYPSAKLLQWLKAKGWKYRLRLKGNLLVDVGRPDVETIADLAAGVTHRFEPQALLFASMESTAIGILHEEGHPEPWIIAMDCQPNRASVMDYSQRWGIEPMFSDYKSRGFNLEDTHLEDPDRLDRMMLFMALAMYWCTDVGRRDYIENPTPTEKKPKIKPTQAIGLCAKPHAVLYPGSSEVCVY